uniref:Uncharacterized protein n=1 Tax=Fundidesulfovibrio putealis TaxID=270496 RepID=A0A7C3W8U5_9BACT
MLGLEKRVDAIRQAQGIEGNEPQGPVKNTANMGVMLALIGILAAVVVYIAVEGKYSGIINSYNERMAAMEAKVAEAANAPRDMARKVIVASTLGEMSQKVNQLKGQLPAPDQQDKLGKIDEMLKSLQQDVSK